MPRFAANLSMLFTEVPMLDRFERAARAGFSSVEIQFPYEATAEQVKERLTANRLKMVLHNLPAGDWAAGDRGMANDPNRVDEFRAGVQRAIEYATVLQVRQLNCLCGLTPAGVDAKTVRSTAVDNLRHAAAELKRAGLKLLIEPVNTFDVPGFWLNRTDLALSVLDEVGADNAYVLFDIYHAQRSAGELAATLEKHVKRIGHIQVADNPGRHEPGSGEINYEFLFAHLDRIGYSGFVGCEYKPSGATEAGLGWLEQARRQLSATS
ncbi:MAG: hydroxypyruvate isomerase [Pseudomonadota bacterium]|nr:hydroxypyruvate isomerase [Pseudomonadota bacterium]